ncbi:MAG: hypothetical protein M3O15_00570, partial [Acidobacteriota bacterium]|nr:hypothetical protein [Acidobacteriota bacterium]
MNEWVKRMGKASMRHRPGSGRHDGLAFALVATLSLVLAGPLPVGADVHPNTEGGFSVDRAYHVGDIDNINLFNGSLTLTIPLGPPFPMGGNLSYGLDLVYNSNPWYYQQRDDIPSGRTYTYANPTPCSNAGLGWHISLGQFMPPCIPASEATTGSESGTVYQGPDGSQHLFYSTLHEGDPDDPGDSPGNQHVLYTRDGTYLRLTKAADGTKTLEFPDGTLHHFNGDGTLAQISDRFSNQVNIAYGPSSWTITDSSTGAARTTYQVFFRHDLPVNGQTVDRVVVTTFGGGSATYQLAYAVPQPIERGCLSNDPTFGAVFVPLLTSVTLPDGSAYAMAVTDYNAPPAPAMSGGQCLKNSGGLLGITLPTLGRIEWAYQQYAFPQGSTAKPFRQQNPGIATRTTRDASGNVEGIWTYTTAMTPNPASARSPQELINTLRDPLGNVTERRFSVEIVPNLTGWSLYDYGAPFSRYVTDPAGTLYLSTRTFNSGGQQVRSEYVAYEHDPAGVAGPPDSSNLNRRELQHRTVYDDDGGVYADTKRSNFDGLGHLRVEQTDGTFPGNNVRTHLTNWNPPQGTYTVNAAQNTGSGFTVFPSSAPWALNTFPYEWTAEQGATAFESSCFDSQTGVLLRRRIHAADGATQSGNDLLAVYGHDGGGNLTAERYYGGDAQPVNLDSPGFTLCNLTPPAIPAYEIDHTYSAGVLATTQHRGASFLSVNKTIDNATGLVQISTDPAGVRTHYLYDALGRPTYVQPDQSAWTVNTYLPATSSASLAQVKVSQTQNGSPTVVRTSKIYTFDGFGRVIREQELMPDGTQSSGSTVYNAMGWKTAVSALGAVGSTQYSLFDPFGRPGAIQPPDGQAHTVRLSYQGVRQLSRTVPIGQQVNGAGQVTESPQTTTEIYDRQGRLYQMIEPPGGLTATYRYDIGNRLSGVSATDPSGVSGTQTRSFSYDRRGFLLSESHPEKGASGGGTVSYLNYDARGHALRRID